MFHFIFLLSVVITVGGRPRSEDTLPSQHETYKNSDLSPAISKQTKPEDRSLTTTKIPAALQDSLMNAAKKFFVSFLRNEFNNFASSPVVRKKRVLYSFNRKRAYEFYPWEEQLKSVLNKVPEQKDRNVAFSDDGGYEKDKDSSIKAYYKELEKRLEVEKTRQALQQLIDVIVKAKKDGATRKLFDSVNKKTSNEKYTNNIIVDNVPETRDESLTSKQNVPKENFQENLLGTSKPLHSVIRGKRNIKQSTMKYKKEKKTVPEKAEISAVEPSSRLNKQERGIKLFKRELKRDLERLIGKNTLDGIKLEISIGLPEKRNRTKSISNLKSEDLNSYNFKIDIDID